MPSEPTVTEVLSYDMSKRWRISGQPRPPPHLSQTRRITPSPALTPRSAPTRFLSMFLSHVLICSAMPPDSRLIYTRKHTLTQNGQVNANYPLHVNITSCRRFYLGLTWAQATELKECWNNHAYNSLHEERKLTFHVIK